MTFIWIRHHHHQQQQQLLSLACSSGGVVVAWPAERLADALDQGHHRASSADAVSAEVRWTLPYVSAATTSTTPQTQPVITASLPVYSNLSHRSLAARDVYLPGFRSMFHKSLLFSPFPFFCLFLVTFPRPFSKSS